MLCITKVLYVGRKISVDIRGSGFVRVLKMGVNFLKVG